MDVLIPILTCSLYIADDSLVRAIAESNAQSNPNFVLDVSVDLTQVNPPPPPQSATEALARTSAILARGGRPLLGLLQLPPAWLSAFGRELPAAFDPCTNIALGTAMLSEFDDQCAAAPTSQASRSKSRAAAATPGRRSCVLRKYEEAIRLPDFATLTTLELRYQRPRPAELAGAPIFAPTATRGSGPDPLLLIVPAPTPSAR